MIGQQATQGLSRAVAVSLVVHGIAMAGIAFVSSTGHTMRAPPEAVEVKLTRLGKKRPENYLPRKELAPPEPQKQAPVPVEKKTEAKPVPKQKAPEKSVDDKLKNLNRLSNALERAKKFEEPEGDPTGSEFGNTSELLEATERSKFVAELTSCLQQNFILMGLNRDQAQGKVGEVILSVQATGKVAFKRLKKGTGDSRLDRQIENAARGCKSVSKAPASIGNAWADGVTVKFKPVP